MAKSLAFKLQQLESRLCTGDGLEVGYSRVLRDAIAENDSQLQAEALKCLGDLHLERGKIEKAARRFDNAAALYGTALLRCNVTDTDGREAIEHRIRYVERLASKVPRKSVITEHRDIENDIRTFQNSVLRVAYTCLTLDRTQAQCGGDLSSLQEVYTKTLVTAIASSDTLLEVEVLKALGDLYLKEGKMTFDSSLLLKAEGMYENARTRCEDPDENQVLLHRVQYTEKIRELLKRKTDFMKKTLRLRKENTCDDEPLAITSSQTAEDSRSYREHYSQGNRAMETGKLDLAEQQFASALKIVHGKEPRTLHLEAECLYKMGNVYLERGEMTEEGADFTKATALYNAALVRTMKKELRKTIVRVVEHAEQSFVRHTLGVDRIPKHFELNELHKNDLKAVRENVKMRLVAIDEEHDPYKHYEDYKVVKEVETSRAVAVKELFQDIAKDRIYSIHNLIFECIDIMGQPPCKFAFIGLGSQATELVTPYSDLEFAILLEEGDDSEDNKHYFRNITHYLHLKIINLGETILPAMGIKSLNDFYSDDPGDSWFYDSVTPHGFTFDGAMPWASKTPIGRQQTKTKPAVELIQTPSKMAFYQNLDVALSEGYHLSDILQNVCYITGERTLVKEYLVAVSATFRKNSVDASVQMADREEFSTPKLTATLLNVKKEIYRFPAIAIQNIALRCGVQASGIWTLIEKLQKGNHVSEENARHLAVLVGISAELRLRTYVENGGQKENMSALLPTGTSPTYITTPDIEKVFYLPNRKMLYRYYYTAVPLRRILSRPQKEQLRLLVTSVLFDCTEEILGKMNLELCNFTSAREQLETDLKRKKMIYGNTANPQISSNLYSLGHVCIKLGDYTQSKNFFEKALKMFEDIHREERAHPDIANSLTSLAIVANYLGDTEKAVALYLQALRILKRVHGKSAAHKDIAMLLNNLGKACGDLGNDREAIEYYEKALSMRERIYGSNVKHPDIASVLNNLGAAWISVGDFRKGVDFYRQVLDMRKHIYGANAAHPDIVVSQDNMGIALTHVGDYKKAIDIHQQALTTYRIVFGRGTVHPLIAITFHNLGSAWQDLGDHKKALDYFEKALAVRKRVFGSDKAHPEIASSLNSIGFAWSGLGDHRTAIRFLQQAIDMRKTTYGQSADHSDVAISLINLGEAWSRLEDYKKAMDYYEEALNMFKRIHGSDAVHPNIALSLNNLGGVYSYLGDHRKAILFCEQSLDMRKAIYGHEGAHPDLAWSLDGLGASCQGLGDYKKAIHFYKKALEMKKLVWGQEATHPRIVVSLNNLGTVWIEMGKYRKAIGILENAFALGKRIYGHDTPHTDISSSLTNLGGAWGYVGDPKKALHFHEEALRMRKRLYGDIAHPKIARSLSNVGTAWSDLDDHKKAVDFYEQALKMWSLLYGRDMSCTEMASILNNLGMAWNNMGDHEKAINLHEKALKMRERLYGDGVAHKDTQSSLQNLASAWSNHGNKAKAIDLNHRALEMAKQLYGRETAHPCIATSLGNLGTVWRLQGENRKAIGFLQKALQMMRMIYGRNTPHRDVLTILTNLCKAWRDMGEEDKAFEVLFEVLEMRQQLNRE
ncbi:uncharacterized protein [Branchiostoma lanceolatum]|uniref:uncharacterized protein n=1 Tax=Branchiostoma lanceolatum TaxID=7740 RepID=UPI0034526252